MKAIIHIVFIVALIGFACKSDHTDQNNIQDGTYFGTFQKQFAFGGGDTAHISIIFSSNTWKGQSDMATYPALCNGTYKIDKQKITFLNLCFWSPDLDESYILSGDYNFTLIGNKITFTRSYLGPSTDSWSLNYSLTKQ